MIPLIQPASNVVIFHSEVAAYFRRRTQESGAGKLFYLKSAEFPENNLGNVAKAKRLRMPNVIGGPSAASKPLLEKVFLNKVHIVNYIIQRVIFSPHEMPRI